jgi:high-affinity Fe2+/Pb2+ permease
MGGIFGGFLGIVDSVGGGFLYILVGESASRPGLGARLMRLLFGASFSGIIISVVMYVMSPERSLQKPVSEIFSIINDYMVPSIFIPPMAILAVTAVLELFRVGLEPKAKEPEYRGLRITPNGDTKDVSDREISKRAA